MIDRAAIIRLVDEQARDGGLWFAAKTAAEAYLQQELRRLHAAIEGVSPDECAVRALAARRHVLKRGQCPECDRERDAKNKHHPSHDASRHCESGKRPHCTCDACF